MNASRQPEFDRLPATERLVLITLRAHVDGCRGSSVETLYRIACGLAWVERAMASFDALARTLVAGARRRPAIGRLADARVTCDEQCLLAVLAAYQLDQPAHAEARARWLVRGDFLARLAVHAGAFARALHRSGRTLSPDWLEAPGRALRAPAPIRQEVLQQIL
ncbi:MAG: hypothetical protein R3286_05380 [Gammaproteobacteria bacterium]|nr:hypothetical protein [Gammaproteobacteria bacterium]